MVRMMPVPEAARMMLQAETARDLMAESPVSVRADAHVFEAVELLTRRGFSAAPVIDESGRPVGVVTRSDLLVHDREALAGPYLPSEETARPHAADYRTRVRDIMTPVVFSVRDIMTPVVFSVAPETLASEVVEQMLDLRVHHLFVVDASQVVIGVISTLDILRHLRR